MEVLTWSPNMTPERAAAHGVQAVDLDTLLARAKVLSLHLVPSAQTRHLINAQRLARMRPDSVLVNTSRSALVDSAALAQNLWGSREPLASARVDELLASGPHAPSSGEALLVAFLRATAGTQPPRYLPDPNNACWDRRWEEPSAYEYSQCGTVPGTARELLPQALPRWPPPACPCSRRSAPRGVIAPLPRTPPMPAPHTAQSAAWCCGHEAGRRLATMPVPMTGAPCGGSAR
jgi:hypothetical protein